MARLAIWFGTYNTCGNVWLNGVGLNKETDEKHDEDCVEEKFQSARIKCDRDGEGVREPLGTPNQGVNI